MQGSYQGMSSDMPHQFSNPRLQALPARAERTLLFAAVEVKGISLCRCRNQDQRQQRWTGVSDPHQRTPPMHPAKKSRTAVWSCLIPTRRRIRCDCAFIGIPSLEDGSILGSTIPAFLMKGGPSVLPPFVILSEEMPSRSEGIS